MGISSRVAILACFLCVKILIAQEPTDDALKVSQQVPANLFLFRTYPNPMNDVLLIEHNYQPDSEFRLMDEAGRVVLMGYLNDQLHLLNVKGLPQGIYYIQVAHQIQRVFKVDV